MKISLADIFDGETHLHNVEMTTNHPASSYGQPVMEFDDGKLCGADCWVLGAGRLVEATPTEAELFAKWKSMIELFAGVK